MFTLPAFARSGSLSPGFRSPAFPHGPHAQSQYTFSSAAGSNSPNPHSPFTSPYRSSPSPCLTSPYTCPTSPNARTPPGFVSPYGVGPPCGAPLSPPPSSPLPPLPSASLPSPAFPVTSLPTPSALPPAMGTAATAAASGRTSPLTALSSSLPSETLYAEDRERRDEHGIRIGDGPWDDAEEGDTTRLSTLDAFRRQLDDSGDGEEIGDGGQSEDEGRVLGVGENKDEREREEEDAHSDGEVGIGLSLMAALGGEEDEEEDREDPAEPARNMGGGSNSESSASGVVGVNGRVSGENGGTTAMPWTRYTPTSPVSVQGTNGHPLRREGESEDDDEEEEEEEEDDGAYWDDIYDGYRYSRYSLASKRFSAASKTSGASKTSSKARANAPPMPVPPDRPSIDASSRPSIGSDGTNGYPRPSLESASSSISPSSPFARPSFARTASEESTHETTMLPLTAQFPAVPVHVPVRTESRLRIVHDGYMQGGDDHGEREQEVEHGSTEDDVGEIELNIEVIGVADEDDDAQGQELDVARPFTSLNANTALSPLLHTTFGSPHSSRFTDLEDGSDQDHVRRYSNKSGKSTLSVSVEGPPKSPVDGGMASALRAKMETERTPSSGSATAPVSSEEPSAHAIVVDDEEGHVTGINITVTDPILATEATSLLAVPSMQTPNVAQTTVVTDPAQSSPRPDDAEKSPFLRPRPQPSQTPHPFARTSMFLPHPNAPKAVPQSQGPMYGRSVPQVYTYPGTLETETGAGNTTNTTTQTQTHPPTPPGTTLYSTHIMHQLRSLSIAAASHGPARRPPMTLFARCLPDLNASMGPVPILFSLDPFPAVATPPSGGQTKVGGKAPYPASMMTPTRAATVSAPVRRGGEGGSVKEGGEAWLRLPKRAATGDAQGSDGGLSSPSLPIQREGFVPQVGAVRPRSRSFSAFGANGPVAVPQERRWVLPLCCWLMDAHDASV